MPASRQNIASGYNLTERRFDGLTTNVGKLREVLVRQRPVIAEATFGELTQPH
jgi:hypothetical protein